MNTQPPQQTRADRDAIIDRLYEIAVEPSALEDLIDLWLDAPRDNADTTERFGDSHADRSHIKRAQSVLQRGESQQLDPKAILAPYGSLATLIVDYDLRVHAANVAAEEGFAAHVGLSVNQLDMPAPMRAALAAALRAVLQNGSETEQVLKADLATDQGALLFRVCRVPNQSAGAPLALVVSTKFLWRDDLSGLLGETFGLTQAEQSVVRLRVEGRDLNAIAKARGTSEGTVRGQIKSVMKKMNVRSQTDIVRMALTLGKFPPADTQAAEFKSNSPAAGWLETQVWKPFLAMDLPDGRKLTYHEMGPKDGNPVLVTHMGSCMVR